MKNYVKKNIGFKKELSDINFGRLKNALVYIKDNLIDSDNKMYSTVHSLIEINIITGSNNIFLRKVSVKPCEYDDMYMDKDLKEDKLYQLVDQFSEGKIDYRDFYSELLDNIIHFSILL